MSTSAATSVLRHVRKLAASDGTALVADRELLERFASRRDETAFASLVQRHGPLVLSVCRRVLHNHADADDVFQSTFLTLARRAGSVGKVGSVAGWLHRVAYRAAVKARRAALDQWRRERQGYVPQARDLLEEITGRELLAVLDEEMQRLPEQFRMPLVLCYLQGRTRDEAAGQLGWAVRTFERRLEQARKVLRMRLARRGVELPAALLAAGLAQQSAPAVVPAALRMAVVQAALRTAAGGPGKTAVLMVMALAAGVMLLGGEALRRGAQPAKPAEAAAASPPHAGVPKLEKATALAGRVLDAEGKPIAGARVAGYGLRDFGRLSLEYREQPLGEVRTDTEGSFRLPLPEVPLNAVHLLAGNRGYGPTWGRVSPISGQAVELRLPLEQQAVGRLIDLQGQPLAGARLRVVRVFRDSLPADNLTPRTLHTDLMMAFVKEQRRQESLAFSRNSSLRDSSLWPAPVTTDAQGRFRLTRFGRGQEVHLLVEDDRCALQEVVVHPGPDEHRVSLLPPHKVTGRITDAETGKPVAGAHVWVIAYRDNEGQGSDGRSDLDGAFAVHAYPGDSFTVQVYPPRGEPYLVVQKSAPWPKGVVCRQVDIALPRGVSVTGRVVESGTGKPVESAALVFLPQEEDNPQLPSHVVAGANIKIFSGADGHFQMIVPPGPGYLATIAPRPEYVHHSVTEGEVRRGKPGGPAYHYNAVLPLDLRVGKRPEQITVSLRRAVTLRGRVVGPDGKAVPQGVIFVPRELIPPVPYDDHYASLPSGSRFACLPVPDGAFEMPQCDPDRTYQVFFLDMPAAGWPQFTGVGVNPYAVVNQLLGPGRLGVSVELSAKQAAGKPVEVKLAPCCSAQLRCMDATGKPARPRLGLELLVRAGSPSAADVTLLTGEKPPLEVDAAGRLTILGLIPGAPYRLMVFAAKPGGDTEVVARKDFVAEADSRVKLDLVVP
jgi:RNA polymerase sigma factor (sigma-70 family)